MYFETLSSISSIWLHWKHTGYFTDYHFYHEGTVIFLFHLTDNVRKFWSNCFYVVLSRDTENLLSSLPDVEQWQCRMSLRDLECDMVGWSWTTAPDPAYRQLELLSLLECKTETDKACTTSHLSSTIAFISWLCHQQTASARNFPQLSDWWSVMYLQLSSHLAILNISVSSWVWRNCANEHRYAWRIY